MARRAELGSQILYSTKASRVEVSVEIGVLDITGAKHVEFQISGDGSVVWVHTEKGTPLRICQIKGPIRISDGRRPPVEPPGDAELLRKARARRARLKKVAAHPPAGRSRKHGR